MSMTVLPYTNVKIQTKKTFEAFQDDTLEVMEARHHLKGYTGHVHAQQHLFSQTFGKTTRRLRGYPPDPQTSKDFIDYAENRPLCVNEFELKHPMKFHHNQLLKTGEGSLGPLPDGARWSSTPSSSRTSAVLPPSSRTCPSVGLQHERNPSLMPFFGIGKHRVVGVEWAFSSEQQVDDQLWAWNNHCSVESRHSRNSVVVTSISFNWPLLDSIKQFVVVLTILMKVFPISYTCGYMILLFYRSFY